MKCANDVIVKIWRYFTTNLGGSEEWGWTLIGHYILCFAVRPTWKRSVACYIKWVWCLFFKSLLQLTSWDLLLCQSEKKRKHEWRNMNRLYIKTQEDTGSHARLHVGFWLALREKMRIEQILSSCLILCFSWIINHTFVSMTDWISGIMEKTLSIREENVIFFYKTWTF